MATILPRQYGSLIHRAADAGLTLLGPGDLYRFLVTGEDTGGSYFAMEAIVPPGGPPPHIHRHEDETFYVVEGRCEFLLGDEVITAGVGDFVNVPRGAAHRFHNASDALVRLIITFTPSGIEGFFEEALERASDLADAESVDIDAVVARYAAAAPRYGIEFL